MGSSPGAGPMNWCVRLWTLPGGAGIGTGEYIGPCVCAGPGVGAGAKPGETGAEGAAGAGADHSS